MIALQQHNVINGNCKWGSNREVIRHGPNAVLGHRLELLTQCPALQRARKQPYERRNDLSAAAAGCFMLFLSLALSLSHA